MRIRLILIAVLLGYFANIKTVFSQTLYVPGGASNIGNNSTNNNVGIGVSDPISTITLNGSLDNTTEPVGISWTNSSLSQLRYGIFRTQGTWEAPNFQQLNVAWSTGIILDPAAGGGDYPKSYVDIRGKGLRVTSGDVGIGTNSPQKLLHIKEPGTTTSTSGLISSSLLVLQGTDAGFETIADASHGSWGSFISLGTANSTSIVNKWGILRRTSNEGGDDSFNITFGSDPYVHFNPILFKISTNGNIGIGTGDNDPLAKLSVNGDILATEVVVQTDVNDYPDFVFEENYKLRTLENLEKYIKNNSHLPEVPSAAEVEANGMDLGKMDKVLLQKIEELTLYVIDLDKQVKQLQKENRELKLKDEK